MTMDSTQALNSAPGVNHNHRLAHIRRFVCNPPEHVQNAVLRVVSIEETPTVLGEWTAVACRDNASLATEIDARLQEHADTIAEAIMANLVWCDPQQGTTVTGKRVKYKPEIELTGLDPAQAAQAEALGIDGTERGRIVQVQREREYAMRSYFSAHQTQIAQSTAHVREVREFAQMQAKEARELAGMLGGLLKESWEANHRSQVELDKLRQNQRVELDRMHLALREAADEVADATGGTDEAPADAKQQLYGQVGKALEVAMPFIAQAIMQRLTAAQAMPASVPDNDNATAPSSAAPPRRAG